MNEYEKQRCLNVERNALKFKEMGLHNLAVQLMDKKKHMETNGKDKYKGIVDDDADFIPSENEIDDEELHNEPPNAHVVSSTLKSKSKKRITRQKKASIARIEMGDYIETQGKKGSTTNHPHVLREPITNAKINDCRGTSNKKRKGVPLSIDRFIQNQDDEPMRQTSEENLLEIQQQREQLRIRIHREGVLPLNIKDHSLLAPEKHQDPNKKHRGSTMLYEVHGRKYEDRKLIIFNDVNQPIGPNKKDVDEFTRFLETIARDHALAPLTYVSWHYVPDKDKIWDYVNERMKEIEAENEAENMESNVDAFEQVMPKERPGSFRIFGRGVTKNDFKGKKLGNSIIISSEVARDMIVGGDVHKDDDQIELYKLMQAQLQEEKETLSKEREAHKIEVQAQMGDLRKMADDLKSQFVKVTEMQKEVEATRDNMVIDVVANAFLQLSKMAPNEDSDSLKEAIAFSMMRNKFSGCKK